MSKKEKKIKNVTEAVGDTSGYDDQAPKFDKKRKITLFAGLGGIVLLIVIVIIFFAVPTKVEFIYLDSATNNEHYQLSKSTGLLVEAPADPTRPNYYFAGWYFSDKFINGELFNNEDDKSLLEYEFSTSDKVTLYAKWLPIEYKITYIYEEGDLFGPLTLQNLEEENLKVNPTTYTIKHEIKAFERTEYVERLREEFPDIYVNHKDAEKNLNEKLEYYENQAKKSTIVLENLPDLPGWTFAGWYDQDGNLVTELSQVSPKEITLTAHWQQNN